MTKRESGWYRVELAADGDWSMAQYFSGVKFWIVTSDCNIWFDRDFHRIDPKMVMTPSGQIVYNQPAHDPLYNTKQEG
ncbi:MAG: hypothetical protein ACRC8W_12485 [Plesiomonas shigelloides]